MDLTLTETATLLGKSERQVRYLLRTGRIAARKDNQRWLIDSASLPLTEAQRAALAARVATATAAFEKVIAGPAKAAKPQRKAYSVTDLDAFRLGAEILHSVRQHDPAGAAPFLLQALEDLARGCHEFHPRHKQHRFGEARDAAARAVVRLLTAAEANGGGAALAQRLETELLPKLTGLIAAQERRGRRAREPGGFGRERWGERGRWRDPVTAEE